MWYIYNGILLSCWKWALVICYSSCHCHNILWIDPENIMVIKINQRKANTTLSHLHLESKKVKQSESRFIDTENKRVVARTEQVERWMEWMKRIKNLKLNYILNMSLGYNIQHYEYDLYYNNFVWEHMVTRLVIISQYVQMSNHYIVHLRLT